MVTALLVVLGVAAIVAFGALVEALADEHSTLRRTGRKIAVTPVPPAVESRCAPSRGWFHRLGAIDPQLIPAVLLAVGWLVIAVEVAW